MKQHTVQLGSIIGISLIVLAYILFSKMTTPVPSYQNGVSTVQTTPVPVTETTTTLKTTTYTLADISSHNTRSSCWMAIDGNVYDVTSYIPQHNPQIVRGCGQDATDMYAAERKHQREGNQLLPEYKIGVLAK